MILQVGFRILHLVEHQQPLLPLPPLTPSPLAAHFVFMIQPWLSPDSMPSPLSPPGCSLCVHDPAVVEPGQHTQPQHVVQRRAHAVGDVHRAPPVGNSSGSGVHTAVER